jgi:hypothetical protein
VVNITGNTPEQVALSLFHIIAQIERKALNPAPPPQGWTVADREWVLDTYGECIRTIWEPQTRGGAPGRFR